MLMLCLRFVRRPGATLPDSELNYQNLRLPIDSKSNISRGISDWPQASTLEGYLGRAVAVSFSLIAWSLGSMRQFLRLGGDEIRPNSLVVDVE